MFAFVHDWKIDVDKRQIQIRFRPYALLVSFCEDFNVEIQIYQLSSQIINAVTVGKNSKENYIFRVI